MKRAKAILVQLIAAAPMLLIAFPTFAGGGGGAGSSGGGNVDAPEPGFLTICAIVAGTEIGRRAIKRLHKG